jgi:hypothetical protein
MIRLVTQFDDVETRASAATPTCGGCCCCCCCCIATVISTSAFTAMNLRAHTRALEKQTGGSPSPWPEIFGALGLLLAAGLALAAGRLGGVTAVGVGVGAWILILLGLYTWVGSETPWVPAVSIGLIGACAFAGEVALGAVLILSGAAIAYLLLAVLVVIGVIVLTHRKLLGET